MFNALQNPLALLGRLLMAYLFLPAGIAKVTNFDFFVGYIAGVAKLPFPQAGNVLALLVEILGSLALIFGMGTRLAALILAFFTLVAAFFFHAYWNVPAADQMIQSLLFTKNIAITGGLLILAAFGPGDWSIDAKRPAK